MLELGGRWAQGDIEKLCSTFTFPLKSLALTDLPTSQIYSVVEALGSEISELRLKKGGYSNPGFPIEAVNLYRVLAACPKLESVDLYCTGHIESKPKYNISAHSFKKFKE